MAQLNTKLIKSDDDTPDVPKTPRANSLAPALPPPKTRMNQVNESGTDISDVVETPRPQPYLTILNIECSSTPMEPILSVTNITVLGSPQSFEATINVPVHTTPCF